MRGVLLSVPRPELPSSPPLLSVDPSPPLLSVDPSLSPSPSGGSEVGASPAALGWATVVAAPFHSSVSSRGSSVSLVGSQRVRPQQSALLGWHCGQVPVTPALSSCGRAGRLGFLSLYFLHPG